MSWAIKLWLALIQSVVAWEETYPNVSFDPEYDLDARERETQAEPTEPPSRLKSILFPKILGSKQRAS